MKTCWEVLASNSAAMRYYAESASARKGEIGSKSAHGASVLWRPAAPVEEQGMKRRPRRWIRWPIIWGRIAMLVTSLAPDVLVVVGEVTRAWSRVGPIVAQTVKARSFAHASTRILATDPEAQPRLQGARALVLQQHFDAPV